MTTETYITDFTKNSDIQTQLIKEFPTGIFTPTTATDGNPGNTLGGSFDIVDDGSGHNFEAISGTLTISVSIPDATEVLSLINAYSPGSGGTLATVEFIGDGGADQTFSLVNGTDTRDFFVGTWANSINGTTTQTAFQIGDVQDGGGTGNVSTGATGTYHLDEQAFTLSTAFATQTLTTIKITSLSSGTPILLGLSAESACYAAGSRILTERGEVAVEALREGDLVVTEAEERLAVVWIGHRRVVFRADAPRESLPVRILAGAFGPGRPRRDLVLSPDHAVYVEGEAGGDGVLIPIRHLVNGGTIRRENVRRITYFHVELPRHAVILAEGLPAESYLDTGNRAAFANGGTVVAATPDFALRVWETEAVAPLVTTGPRLAAAKARLLARAEALGHGGTDDPALAVLADGREVRPDGGAAGLYRFRLPEGAAAVRLVSRAAVPAEVVAGSEDHRLLGVAVTGLWLDGREVGLDDARLVSGWWPGEAGLRWTRGDAELPPAREILVRVVPRMLRYPVARADARRRSVA